MLGENKENSHIKLKMSLSLTIIFVQTFFIALQNYLTTSSIFSAGLFYEVMICLVVIQDFHWVYDL